VQVGFANQGGLNVFLCNNSCCKCSELIDVKDIHLLVNNAGSGGGMRCMNFWHLNLDHRCSAKGAIGHEEAGGQEGIECWCEGRWVVQSSLLCKSHRLHCWLEEFKVRKLQC